MCVRQIVTAVVMLHMYITSTTHHGQLISNMSVHIVWVTRQSPEVGGEGRGEGQGGEGGGEREGGGGGGRGSGKERSPDVLMV